MLLLLGCYLNFLPLLRWDWSGSRTSSCGTSGTGETPQAQPRRLTARPASRAAGAEIHCFSTATIFVNRTITLVEC
ncbi:hypothetical protein FZC80_11590 [Rossellomorea aquimaris]|uniref:Uncharacterized protein n=1 Tax=Rossellomorea aquimaris TaxID=189382 RepID=A0A5D4TTN7_9BACI|nr:hypothetical protein FZC80_11590 [Rossellomorea aquimaris]